MRARGGVRAYMRAMLVHVLYVLVCCTCASCANVILCARVRVSARDGCARTCARALAEFNLIVLVHHVDHINHNLSARTLTPLCLSPSPIEMPFLCCVQVMCSRCSHVVLSVFPMCPGCPGVYVLVHCVHVPSFLYHSICVIAWTSKRRRIFSLRADVRAHRALLIRSHLWNKFTSLDAIDQLTMVAFHQSALETMSWLWYHYDRRAHFPSAVVFIAFACETLRAPTSHGHHDAAECNVCLTMRLYVRASDRHDRPIVRPSIRPFVRPPLHPTVSCSTVPNALPARNVDYGHACIIQPHSPEGPVHP